VDYQWPLAGFAGGAYHLRAHGPNGFYREFKGTADDPAIDIVIEPERNGEKLTGNVTLVLTSRGGKASVKVKVEDASYGAAPMTLDVEATVRKTVPLEKSHGWYDLRVTVAGAPAFAQRFAGHVETGLESRTDPLMGGTAG
jgi:phospholipase C